MFDFLISAPLYEPEQLAAHLSHDAQEVVRAALQRLDGRLVVDYHCHLAGTGRGGTSGCCVHPSAVSPKAYDLPGQLDRAKMRVFMSAFGISPTQDDEAAASRIARLAQVTGALVTEHKQAVGTEDSGLTAPDSQGVRVTQHIGLTATGTAGYKCLLLPFAGVYDRDSNLPQPERTVMQVPNEYPQRLAAARPDIFAAACSVNPHSLGAVAELERCHGAGARVCKWLPNSQHIHPDDARCDPFYTACSRLGMAILTHAGDETSVQLLSTGRVDQSLGNPLLLRRALDAGTKVIVAHFASEGSARDDDGIERPCWEILLQMMLEPRYEGLLFADISALTMFKRLHVLKFVLEHPEVHHRLVFGTDYPVCALGGRIIGTRPLPAALLRDPAAAFSPQLVNLGLVSHHQAQALDEVFQYNPILFDLVLKLTVRHPQSGQQFPASLFAMHPDLPIL